MYLRTKRDFQNFESFLDALRNASLGFTFYEKEIGFNKKPV